MSSAPQEYRRLSDRRDGRDAEVLDFCAAHNIVSDIEMITMQEINSAYERLVFNDVRYRFVIDMASLRNS